MVGVTALFCVDFSSGAQAQGSVASTVTDNSAPDGETKSSLGDLYGWEFSGQLTGGTRFYLDANPYSPLLLSSVPGLNSSQWFPYVSGEAKLTHTSADGRQRLTFEVNGRYDFRNGRGQGDIPEANYYYNAGSWSILAGIHKVFWGVAESEHLVNVINTIQYNGDPFADERLGQPMLNLNFTGDMGTLALYGLLGFREVDFGPAADRLPVGRFVKEDVAQFEDGNARHFAFAGRYSNTVNMHKGSLDYAVSYFHGTSRDAAAGPGPRYGARSDELPCPVL